MIVVAVVAVAAVNLFALWAAFAAGFDDGWLAHSECRVSPRWPWNPAPLPQEEAP